MKRLNVILIVLGMCIIESVIPVMANELYIREDVSIEEESMEDIENEQTEDDPYVDEKFQEELSEEQEDEELNSEEEKKVEVEEIDLGDYMETMTIGEKQLISVTLLPYEADGEKITYTSSNTSVATINGMGRILALSVGNTTITVSCGGKNASFSLSVKEEESDEIAVTDIEIGEYEKELNVDEKLELTVNVLPLEASDSTVKYESSNTAVATVNSSGEVKGISAGDVIIYVTAGNMKKEVPIKVKVKTTGIEVNTDYIVLKEGEGYQLNAKALPDGANQNITYRSEMEAVATVTSGGYITASKVGSTVIIVSNEESSVAVSVIVNKEYSTDSAESENGQVSGEVPIEKTYNLTVNANEEKVIDTEMLKYLYETQEVLTIKGKGYSIKIDGKDIVNYNNVFDTDIMLEETDKGIQFNLNKGKSLCGKVTVYLDDKSGKYLYLYNDSKEKYEMIECESMSEIELTIAGKYLIASKKVTEDKTILKYAAVSGGVVLIVLAGVYIGLKKKYWFW